MHPRQFLTITKKPQESYDDFVSKSTHIEHTVKVAQSHLPWQSAGSLPRNQIDIIIIMICVSTKTASIVKNRQADWLAGQFHKASKIVHEHCFELRSPTLSR